MPLKFTPNKRVFAAQLNNTAYQLRYGVVSGCEVTESTPAAMSVDVAAGVILFNGSQVNVSSTTVPIDAADPSYDRIDIVVVDNTGTVSVLKGTPESTPKAPDYDPETYVPLALITVQDLATSITNADIEDIRIITSGGGGGASSVIKSAPQSGCSDGQVVRFDGTNFVPAQADAIANSKAVGIINNVSGGTGDVYLFGQIDFLSGLTPGETYYLSDTTAGALTTTKPFIAVKIGEAIAADTLLLDIDRVTSASVSRHVESFTAQTSLTINHNLNDENVIVQVYDDTGEQITPDTIDIVDANTVNVTFTISTSGKVIIFSLNGSVDTGTSAYYSEAFTNQTSLTINHNLNQKYVNVQVYDDSDNLIEPQNVTLVDNNSLTITFGAATSGRVVIVGGSTFTSIGGAGDIIPQVNNAYDLGSVTNKWRNGFFGSDVVVDGELTVNTKLTVNGGIDPTYIQLTPQTDSSGVPNNSLFIDDADKKVKLKDDAGSVTPVSEKDPTPYVFNGLNIIRQVVDRAIEFSKGEGFADAYVDADGQLNSVAPVDFSNAITTEALPVGFVNQSITAITATWTVHQNNAFIRRVGVYHFGSDLIADVTISINGVGVVASKQKPYSAASSVYFNKNDYSQLPQAGDTVTVTITKVSGSLNINYTQIGSDITGSIATLKSGSRICREESSFNFGQEWVVEDTTQMPSIFVTAEFNTDKYLVNSSGYDDSSDTLNNTNFLNPENAFDSDTTTFAQITDATTSATLEKIFPSPAYIGSVRLVTQTYAIAVDLQTYDGSTWNTVQTINTNGNISQSIININSTIQGIRLNTAGNTRGGDVKVFIFDYTMKEALVVHNIPTGTFSSDISSSIGVPFIDELSDGTIQYKLTNGTDDSGWLDINTFSQFTTFTSEPTQLIIKLTKPTTGNMSIKGFWVYAK